MGFATILDADDEPVGVDAVVRRISRPVAEVAIDDGLVDAQLRELGAAPALIRQLRRTALENDDASASIREIAALEQFDGDELAAIDARVVALPELHEWLRRTRLYRHADLLRLVNAPVSQPPPAVPAAIES